MADEVGPSRHDRIETYYHLGTRELAERIVDLEEETAEISRLTELLRYEHNRANSAIDREETAEQAAEEMREERDRYAAAWKSAHRRAALTEARLRVAVLSRDRRTKWLSDVLERAVGYRRQRDRYRLAWLSARRRAADEANFGMEALDRERERYAVLRRAYLRSGEGITSLTTALVEQGEELKSRQSTHAPRLEHMGTEEDGGTVWRLLGTTTDGADVYIAPVGVPAPSVR